MKYFAVIDTNVLVSAMFNWKSVPGVIATETLDGEICPLLNDAILAEYKDVLYRPKFNFDREAVKVLVDGLVDRGIFVDAHPVDELVPDPKDVVFYEVAFEAQKEDEAYLVTGNTKHFPVKPFVVTPREMLEIIEKGK